MTSGVWNVAKETFEPTIIGTITANTMNVTDVEITDRSRLHLTYRLTDIYNQEYWTEAYRIGD